MKPQLTPTDDVLLLAAIRAQPFEMTPKLAFLDWADENVATVHRWLATAVESQPLLTTQGIGILDQRPNSARRFVNRDVANARFINHRSYLLTEHKPFAVCLTFLACCVARQKIDPGPESYGFKHVVERHFDNKFYIPNGTFIAATIHAGFMHEVVFNSLNTTHNFSRRSPVLKQRR